MHKDDPVRVDRISARFTRRAQLWRDGWRNVDRVCRFTGMCVVCGLRTYAFDDGENDPRGVLGDRADHSLTASDFERTGPDVPLCAICGNVEDRYTRAVAIAERRWARFAARNGDAS